jgi:hypothetical protein
MTNGKYINSRKSEYPVQNITRLVEAAYMLGVIDDVDEGSCRKVRQAIETNGRSRQLPSGEFQIIKDI